jgi:hypothetical protein
MKRTIWPLVFYLVGFVGLLLLVCFGYIKPAAEALPHATGHEKLGLVAYARLLMMLTLFVLFVGLLLMFRAHRFFLPGEPNGPTKYTDAWAEAGKRAKPEDFKEPE